MKVKAKFNIRDVEFEMEWEAQNIDQLGEMVKRLEVTRSKAEGWSPYDV